MSTTQWKSLENETVTPSMPQEKFADIAGKVSNPLKVFPRQGGDPVPYDVNRIIVAVTKAFLAVEGGQAAASTRIHEVVNEIAEYITQVFYRRLPAGGNVHLEEIQDQVELVLMRRGEHKVARAYVLYREERRREREEAVKAAKAEKAQEPVLHVLLQDGHRVPLDQARMKRVVEDACRDLLNVEPRFILESAKRNLFDGVPVGDVSKALVMSSRTLIEQDPNYSFVTARLLLDDLRSEALGFLGVAGSATFPEMAALYPQYFRAYIEKGIECELLSPVLKTFDLDRMAKAIISTRDLQWTYLGLQTIYDRYLLHSHGTRFELPQAFLMRVAMGLALEEKDREGKAIEFYQLLSEFDVMSSTPTLFNAGTLRSQLSSCFLTTVPDDLDGIFEAIKDNALLSKYAGGLGNDWTPVRAMNARIKGTNGKSQGVVPFMKVANDTAVAVNQGGKRKGAVCGYLETWHLDIEEFLELRKNTGDDRRRTHDMNTANWVPDLFMKRVFEDQEWTLFSPNDVPELHDLYGLAFEKAYVAYEQKAASGQVKNFKKISAKNLWRKMLSMLFETGHPWVTFKDVCNLRSPQQHVGVVHSSNLCTEITLNTSKEEVAVCNLASINLLQHMTPTGLNIEKLRKTVRAAIRMLDNVININFYSIPQAKNSNMKHRPIGLGIMGFQDCLYELRIPYSSKEAVAFADLSMEYVSYFAIEASHDLSIERGSYESFQGSLWSQGIMPIDSIALLKESRGQYLDQDQEMHTNLDWAALREKVKRGMRNSNVMAIAPTATISNICGVSQSIEPTYQNLYVKSNMSGEFTVVNPYLVKDLKALGLWDGVMVNDLKYYDGSVQSIDRVPAELKALYATAFEIEAEWLVAAGAARQKWIDQSQSLNLYMAKPSGAKLDKLYRQAWIKGLKTTYYLRTLGATSTEKSTIERSKLNAVEITPMDVPKACSIADPECEACQ